MPPPSLSTSSSSSSSPASLSRGKRLPYARLSCDGCKRRKVRCVWSTGHDGTASCQRCAKRGLACSLQHPSSPQQQNRTVCTDTTTPALLQTILDASVHPLLPSTTTPHARQDEQDVCRVGRPLWQLKRLVQRLPQYADIVKRASSGPVRRPEPLHVDAFMLWNPFLMRNDVVDDDDFDGSFLHRVVWHILYVDDTASVLAEALQLLVDQHGTLHDAQALLLLALYDPVDLLRQPSARTAGCAPSYGMLLTCMHILSAAVLSKPSTEMSDAEASTCLAVFVAVSIVSLSMLDDAMRKELLEAPLFVRVQQDSSIFTQRTWSDLDPEACRALVHRAAYCQAMVHASLDVEALMQRPNSTLDDTLTRLLERLTALADTVDDARYTGAPFTDARCPYSATFATWLDVEACTLFACLPPRTSWLVFSHHLRTVPPSQDLPLLLNMLTASQRRTFHAINHLNARFGCLGSLASTFVEPGKSALACSPGLLTLSYALAAVEGCVEVQAAMVRMAAAATPRPTSQDAVLGSVAHADMCAQGLSLLHRRHALPLYGVLADVVKTFADILLQIVQHRRASHHGQPSLQLSAALNDVLVAGVFDLDWCLLDVPDDGM